MESVNTLDEYKHPETLLPNSSNNTRKRSESLSIRIGRRFVKSVLAKIKDGSITLNEDNRRLSFGVTPNAHSNCAALLHREVLHGEVLHGEVLHAEIQVLNPVFYRKVLFRGSLGAAESWMEGDWHTESLTVLVRIISRNLELINRMDSRGSILKLLFDKLQILRSNNSIAGSKRNIAAHYDLSNAFFSHFLSKDMMYSSAIFAHPDMSLEAASRHKLDTICRKLELKPDDHLLEIGSGWGGMAIHAAQHYGCKVTTTTISEQQYLYTLQQVKLARLEHKITVLKEDYRRLHGQFDKLVSIEMLEAVGHTHYKTYFSQCNKLLKSTGLMLVQAITVPDQRYHLARNSVDFIKKYIFPGGCLPSTEIIARHIAADTDMQIISLQDITEDYALTLRYWRENFTVASAAIRKSGIDDSFQRMWQYYLSYCEGGFKERVIGTAQFVFAKNRYRNTQHQQINRQTHAHF